MSRPTDEHWLHSTEAAATARAATSHNSGETVWEQWKDGDAVVLRMSSWPRAREAEVALLERGWEVQYLPTDAKGHTLIRITEGEQDAESG